MDIEPNNDAAPRSPALQPGKPLSPILLAFGALL